MTTTQAKTMTTQEVVDCFHALAQLKNGSGSRMKFFSEDVRSIDPEGSPYFGYAQGKADVRKKGEVW